MFATHLLYSRCVFVYLSVGSAAFTYPSIFAYTRFLNSYVKFSASWEGLLFNCCKSFAPASYDFCGGGKRRSAGPRLNSE